MKLKKLKGLIVSFILGGLVFGGIGVAAVTITAKEIRYTPNNEEFDVTNVQEAIDEIYKISQYEIPEDTYYYEKGTEGSVDTIIRYKKINEKYYECDVNGNVSEGASDIDVSSKTLIPYTAMNAANLKAGVAGYASKSFILGAVKDKESILKAFYSNSSQVFTLSGIKGNATINSDPVYLYTNPDGKDALLNTISFGYNIMAYAQYAGEGAWGKATIEYKITLEDGTVIKEGSKGVSAGNGKFTANDTINVNLFECDIQDNKYVKIYIKITSSGSGAVGGGDALGYSSAEVGNISLSYINLE